MSSFGEHLKATYVLLKGIKDAHLVFPQLEVNFLEEDLFFPVNAKTKFQP